MWDEVLWMNDTLFFVGIGKYVHGSGLIPPKRLRSRRQPDFQAEDDLQVLCIQRRGPVGELLVSWRL